VRDWAITEAVTNAIIATVTTATARKKPSRLITLKPFSLTPFAFYLLKILTISETSVYQVVEKAAISSLVNPKPMYEEVHIIPLSVVKTVS
jgi:hypothetical protein